VVGGNPDVCQGPQSKLTPLLRDALQNSDDASARTACYFSVHNSSQKIDASIPHFAPVASQAPTSRILMILWTKSTHWDASRLGFGP